MLIYSHKICQTISAVSQAPQSSLTDSNLKTPSLYGNKEFITVHGNPVPIRLLLPLSKICSKQELFICAVHGSQWGAVGRGCQSHTRVPGLSEKYSGVGTCFRVTFIRMSKELKTQKQVFFKHLFKKLINVK